MTTNDGKTNHKQSQKRNNRSMIFSVKIQDRTIQYVLRTKVDLGKAENTADSLSSFIELIKLIILFVKMLYFVNGQKQMLLLEIRHF